MSYEAAVVWSIGRSMLAGAVCLWIARGLVARQIHHGGTEVQRTGRKGSQSKNFPRPSPYIPLLLLLVPLFMPGLVVGYAYRNASLSLVHTWWLNEALYLAIVIGQITPVVVLALEWLPAATMSSAGAFLLDQVRPQLLRQRVGAWLAGEWPRHATAFVIAALLCFQEVEIATLMQARGWAEWIFTKQAGGVELSEVWRFLVLPVAYGFGLVLPVLWYWLGRRETNGERREREVPPAVPQPSTFTPQRFYLLSAWLLVVAWPIASLAIGAFRGRDAIYLRAPIWREIGDALIQAGTVTALFWGIFRLIDHFRMFPPSTRGERGARGRRGQWFVIALILPGLLGSLALGLSVFEICQRIGMQPSYSPVPLVAAMVLFLLPRGLAMRMMLLRNEGQSNLYLARQMAVEPQSPGTRTSNEECGFERETDSNSCLQPSTLNSQHSGRSIVWQLQGAGRFWTLALLFWWSYLELTLPSLLRPAGMAPAPMRLYNFLHYGHIPGLAAMLVIVLGVPVLAGGLWLMVYRKILQS